MLQLITHDNLSLNNAVIFYNIVKEELQMRRIRQELLSKTIKNKREKLSLSQSDLAAATHINRAMISKIENGTYMPSIGQLEDLQEVLGFELDEVREPQQET